MQKVGFLVAAGLALGSVAAFAQMQNPPAGDNMQMPRHRGGMESGTMHEGMMRGGTHHGMMHGGMMGRVMQPGSRDHDMSGHASTLPKGDTGPSSLAFQGINAKMHDAMNIAFTGKADVDFVKAMIPHHRGAVDMARTVLAFGTDPQVRKLAEEIVKAQESEIALMSEWLQKNGE